MKDVAVVDIGYGDGGKGALVDRLCAAGDVGLVVRWNGGCQAQHNVVQDDGRWHTFSQLGSGSFHDVPTYLADPVMVEPLSMVTEAESLAKLIGYNPLLMLSVDPSCRLTTPYHWLVNRWQEDRLGDARHGSTGRGIGMTALYALNNPGLAPRVRDIDHLMTLELKLNMVEDWARLATNNEVSSQFPDRAELVERYVEWRRQVAMAERDRVVELARDKRIVYEGAQGMLLDEDWGWHPHTTWSHVDPEWVRDFCDGPYGRELEVVGVTRAYTTRHGAGPFVAEDASLNLPESHNRDEHFQGNWRVGHFDLPAIQYGARCAQVDSIYVTHIDTARNEPELKVCESYRYNGVPFGPLPLLAWDFKGRAAQTSRLAVCEPVLVDRPQDGWAASISQLLELPLYGIGTGPATSDSTFMARL